MLARKLQLREPIFCNRLLRSSSLSVRVNRLSWNTKNVRPAGPLTIHLQCKAARKSKSKKESKKQSKNEKKPAKKKNSKPSKPSKQDDNTKPSKKKQTRRLVLLRHAKSYWGDPTLADRDRPLATRGRKNAKKVAKALGEKGWLPDLILSSDSKRTRETLESMAEVTQEISETRTVFLPSFYDKSDTGEQTLKEIQRQVSKQAKASDATVLCLGHNFGWEEAASLLSGEEVELRTANAALFESTSPSRSWSAGSAALSSAAWALTDVLRVRRKNLRPRTVAAAQDALLDLSDEAPGAAPHPAESGEEESAAVREGGEGEDKSPPSASDEPKRLGAAAPGVALVAAASTLTPKRLSEVAVVTGGLAAIAAGVDELPVVLGLAAGAALATALGDKSDEEADDKEPGKTGPLDGIVPTALELGRKVADSVATWAEKDNSRQGEGNSATKEDSLDRDTTEDLPTEMMQALEAKKGGLVEKVLDIKDSVSDTFTDDMADKAMAGVSDNGNGAVKLNGSEQDEAQNN